MPFRFAAATAAVIPSQALGVVLYRVLLLPCIMSACVMGHGFPSKTRWMDGRTDGWACRSLHGGNPLFFRHGLKLCETVCQTRRFLAHSSTQSVYDGRWSEVLLPLVRDCCPIAETLIHCLAMLEVGRIFFLQRPLVPALIAPTSYNSIAMFVTRTRMVVLE